MQDVPPYDGFQTNVWVQEIDRLAQQAVQRVGVSQETLEQALSNVLETHWWCVHIPTTKRIECDLLGLLPDHSEVCDCLDDYSCTAVVRGVLTRAVRHRIAYPSVYQE